MNSRTTLLLPLTIALLCGCDGKTAAQDHHEAAAQETAGGVKQGVGAVIGDTSLRKSGAAETDRGRAHDKVGDVKDAVHNVLH